MFEPDFCGSEHLGRSDPANLIDFVAYTCKRCKKAPVRNQSEASQKPVRENPPDQSETSQKLIYDRGFPGAVWPTLGGQEISILL